MDLPLETRPGLPPALRVLLRDHPREGWEADPRFAGLAAFWMDRHLAFRDILAALGQDAARASARDLDPRAWGARLSRLGSHLLADLHGHHRIEDDHYFPLLAAREPRLSAGFALLDADHAALDAHLAAFADRANAALRLIGNPKADAPGEAGRVSEHLARLTAFLDRHLTDEEDLVVPVILRHGA
jgi:iron-sulfur cluster repair protein YtfE (RIC family)